MTEKRFVEVPVGGNPFYEPKPEKRFEATYDDGYCVFDNETNQLYHTENEDVAMLLAELMNKQEGDIKQLKQEIKQYWKCRDKWKQEAKELKEENKQLKKARDKSDKFIVKKGLEIEFLAWCMK